MEIGIFLNNFAHYVVSPSYKEMDEVIEWFGLGGLHKERIAQSHGESFVTHDLYSDILMRVLESGVVPKSELDKLNSILI